MVVLFDSPPLDELVVSPLGVVPKKEPNKFQLIHHLSYPRWGSLNEFIDPGFCSVSFDAAVQWVRFYGQGALLAKMDIESTFRLLPLHPDSFHLLCCRWQGGYFLVPCLKLLVPFLNGWFGRCRGFRQSFTI